MKKIVRKTGTRNYRRIEEALEIITLESDPSKLKKKSFGQRLFGVLVYIAILLTICVFLSQYVIQKTIVDGTSMENTLYNEDQLILAKSAYIWREPQRFDIVVFNYHSSQQVHYIKRIIGLPGETVQIMDGIVYIDGKKLETDTYGKEIIYNPGMAADPLVLGEDEYFVLGDNRNGSADSRDSGVGLVLRSQIIGKAVFRIWPLSRIGLLE